MRLDAAVALSAIWLLPSTAKGEEFFVERIPNGMNADFVGSRPCQLCHERAQGGGDLNAFGLAFDGPRLWRLIYHLDSDRDGQTNGFELGDPNGTWVRGQTPDRTEHLSFPGDPNSLSFPPGYDGGVRPDTGLLSDVGAPDSGILPDLGDLSTPRDDAAPDLGSEKDVGADEDAGVALDQGPPRFPQRDSPEPSSESCSCSMISKDGTRWNPWLGLGFLVLLGIRRTNRYVAQLRTAGREL